MSCIVRGHELTRWYSAMIDNIFTYALLLNRYRKSPPYSYIQNSATRFADRRNFCLPYVIWLTDAAVSAGEQAPDPDSSLRLLTSVRLPAGSTAHRALQPVLTSCIQLCFHSVAKLKHLAVFGTDLPNSERRHVVGA